VRCKQASIIGDEASDRAYKDMDIQALLSNKKQIKEPDRLGVQMRAAIMLAKDLDPLFLGYVIKCLLKDLEDKLERSTKERRMLLGEQMVSDILMPNSQKYDSLLTYINELQRRVSQYSSEKGIIATVMQKYIQQIIALIHFWENPIEQSGDNTFLTRIKEQIIDSQENQLMINDEKKTNLFTYSAETLQHITLSNEFLSNEKLKKLLSKITDFNAPNIAPFLTLGSEMVEIIKPIVSYRNCLWACGKAMKKQPELQFLLLSLLEESSISMKEKYQAISAGAMEEELEVNLLRLNEQWNPGVKTEVIDKIADIKQWNFIEYSKAEVNDFIKNIEKTEKTEPVNPEILNQALLYLLFPQFQKEYENYLKMFILRKEVSSLTDEKEIQKIQWETVRTVLVGSVMFSENLTLPVQRQEEPPLPPSSKRPILNFFKRNHSQPYLASKSHLLANTTKPGIGSKP
jgi:hypothetical protein